MDELWAERGRGARQFARRMARRDPQVVTLLEIVAAEIGVPPDTLLARSRCRAQVAEARWLAMYLAHVALGRPIYLLAKIFRRNWSTVSRACMRFEDRRDRPEVDALLTRLEAVIVSATEKRRKEVRRGAR